MKMEKTMKVTIGGRVVVVSDPYRKESIKDILIFGGGNVSREEASLPALSNGKKIKKRKSVRREIVQWTAAETDKLKSLVLRGTTISEMAMIFGKKYYKINNKLRQLGIVEEYKRVKAYKEDEAKKGFISEESQTVEDERSTKSSDFEL